MRPRSLPEPNQRRSAATPPSAKTLISFQGVRALAGGVAAARNRLNEMRTLGGITQHFAQAINGFFECQLVVNEGVSRPHALAEFLTGDDFLRMFQQDLQHLERLAREFLLQPAFANLTGLQIHFEDTEPYEPWLVGHGDLGPLCSKRRRFYHGSVQAWT